MQINAVETNLVSPRVSKYVAFLHEHLGRFRDEKESIEKCFKYLLSENGGGHVFEVRQESQNELLGLSVVLNTNMAGFLPENFLVYIAVSEAARGRGIGGKLICYIQEYLGKEICLHVEKDNPAKKLYERCGFTNKYDEMRFYPHGNS